MSLYFVPNRVAEEFRSIVKQPEKHTMPIIKRKLTAMVQATDWRKELIDEGKDTYKHVFNGIVIIVEKSNMCIQRVYREESPSCIDGRSGHYYKVSCRNMGLNSDRTDFSPRLDVA